jgi:hypothetical protein
MSEQPPTIQQVHDRLQELTNQPGDTSISDVVGFIEVAAAHLGWPCIDSDQADDSFSMLFKRGGL